VTNEDGRCTRLLPAGSTATPGLYAIRFFTKEYFEAHQETSFYPFVEVHFEVKDTAEHYHIPLLLSRHSYTTYRGS
ncbi:hypothetical protein H4R33_007092, partial [Dimargaris cristalligena]